MMAKGFSLKSLLTPLIPGIVFVGLGYLWNVADLWTMAIMGGIFGAAAVLAYDKWLGKVEAGNTGHKAIVGAGIVWFAQAFLLIWTNLIVPAAQGGL